MLFNVLLFALQLYMVIHAIGFELAQLDTIHVKEAEKTTAAQVGGIVQLSPGLVHDEAIAANAAHIAGPAIKRTEGVRIGIQAAIWPFTEWR